jgi:hypothetical protein
MLIYPCDHVVLCFVKSRNIVVQVVEETLGHICEKLYQGKLNLLWTCMLEKG